MSNVELDREVDGRWIAEVPDVPGAMAYGETREEAVRNVVALAEQADPLWSAFSALPIEDRRTDEQKKRWAEAEAEIAAGRHTSAPRVPGDGR